MRNRPHMSEPPFGLDFRLLLGHYCGPFRTPVLFKCLALGGRERFRKSCGHIILDHVGLPLGHHLGRFVHFGLPLGHHFGPFRTPFETSFRTISDSLWDIILGPSGNHPKGIDSTSWGQAFKLLESRFLSNPEPARFGPASGTHFK